MMIGSSVIGKEKEKFNLFLLMLNCNYLFYLLNIWYVTKSENDENRSRNMKILTFNRFEGA